MLASHRTPLRFAVCAFASAVLATVLALVAPGVARADTVTLQNNAIPQRRSPKNDLVDHPAVPYGINFDDCEKDVEYDFGVGVDTTAHILQVWAGQSADCTDPAQRNVPTGGCWPVTGQITQVQMTQTVAIKGRDIAAHLGDVGQANQFVYNPAGEEACHHQQTPNGFHLTLYFMLFDGATYVAGQTNAQYPIVVDTLGPPQPCAGPAGNLGSGTDSNDIGIGDGELMPSWLPPVSSDFFGVRLFCTPNPSNKPQSTLDQTVAPIAPSTLLNAICSTSSAGSDGGTTSTTTGDGGTSTGAPIHEISPVDAGATDAADGGDGAATASDAGDAGDAGDGATGPVTPGADSCGTALVDGMEGSSIPDDYRCGDFMGMSVTKTTVTGLTNNTKYTFAVGGIDQLGNAGPIRLLGCQTPGPIQDFYGAYVDAGGTAGGGYCATPPPGRREEPFPVGESVFVVIVVGSGLAFVRRRRRAGRA